jgi:nucleotide-binding universal stress UspA family protein
MAKVLVAVDGSELARRAAHEAHRLLAPDSDVTVLSVVRPVVLPVGDSSGLSGVGAVAPVAYDEISHGADSAARADVDDVIDELGLTGRARPRVIEGDPGSVICHLAADERFDLIVLGSHGSGIVKRALLGSVSHHVLHHAPCPVLVVRAQRDDADRH